MKRFLILLFFLPLLCKGQVDTSQFFNNVNGELCLFLYETNDPLGPYRVFMVVEEMSQEEIEKVCRMKKGGNLATVQRWAMEGYRIESERSPYITYPPKFPQERNYPELKPVKAESGKDHWGDRKNNYGFDEDFQKIPNGKH